MSRSIHKYRIRKTILSILGVAALYLIIQDLVLTESKSKTLPEPTSIDCFEFTLPDSNLSRDIFLNLKAAIAIDNESRNVVYCYNADDIRPVASLTKLLSAMIILDNYDPEVIIEINRQDCYRSSRSLFRKGDKVRARDLLYAALLRSDNRSRRALARTTSGSIEIFAQKMNDLADELGLEDTQMYEPTGLDERNRSTAADCARRITVASNLYPEIAEITSLKTHTIKPVNRKRKIKLINTNKMVFSKYDVLAGKTGYIIESDYCLATVLKNGKGREITIVVLGAPGPQTRFREARRLANYVFRRVG